MKEYAEKGAFLHKAKVDLDVHPCSIYTLHRPYRRSEGVAIDYTTMERPICFFGRPSDRGRYCNSEQPIWLTGEVGTGLTDCYLWSRDRLNRVVVMWLDEISNI
jgi:hypothetical protein